MGLPADRLGSGSCPSSQLLPLWLEKALRADHITPHPLPTGCMAFRNKARKSRIAIIKPCSVSQKQGSRDLGHALQLVERALELESGSLDSGPNPGTV